MTQPLKAPFPYPGGKSRCAAQIWERLGDPAVYLEPFSGSLAVLLARPTPPRQREVVADANGLVVNFWRAIQWAADEVAYWADYPTYHDDLIARRLWVMEWSEAHAQRLQEDADYYDPKAAGWWVWGQSSSIDMKFGLRECDSMERSPPSLGGRGVQSQKDMRIPTTEHGKGVAAQRKDVQYAGDVPHISNHGNGRGGNVERQRKSIPHFNCKSGGKGVAAQRCGIPHIHDRDGGQGVHPQRNTLDANEIGSGARLLPWFRALQQRLARVYILNREWPTGTSDSIRQQTKTASIPASDVALFLDPPYRQTPEHYLVTNKDVAVESYEWAVAHAEHRIAYCCCAGDFPVPDGWTTLETTMGGIRRADRRAAGKAKDLIMFSPACVPPAQRGLFA